MLLPNLHTVSQEAGQEVWYSHLFQNFPQFIVIHTVKGSGIVNKAEGDVFLELSCVCVHISYCSQQQYPQQPRYGNNLDVHQHMHGERSCGPYAMDCYSAIKKNEPMPCAATCMQLEITIKSEKERQIPSDITYMESKYDTNEPSMKQKDTHTYRTGVQLPRRVGEGRSGRVGEQR